MSETLKIKIYRGANQIGGCATEISYGEERILIDLGANLPGTNEAISMSDKELLSKVFDGRPCKGVLFTHYHGDHNGLWREIPDNVDMYIGGVAKEIMSVLAKTLSESKGPEPVEAISSLNTFRHGEPIFETGKIQVTPIMTDHSAIDAYMFLIEVAEKRILFTGDFRDHGIASENNRFWNILKECVPEAIDVLITEGTMMSRGEEVKKNIVHTEQELGIKAKEIFKKCAYNFVLVSSTNLDTIMELYRNTPKGKLFVVDSYQAEVMLTAMKLRKNLFEKYNAQELKKGEFCKPIYVIGKRGHGSNRVFAKNIDMLKAMAEKIHLNFWVGKANYDKLAERGFVMLVRPNRFRENGENCFEEAIKNFSDKEVQLIYSMWKGYLEGDKADKDIVYLEKLFPDRIDLHTSGHAYVETIAKLINEVKPKKVIPMHTEFANGFQEKEEFANYDGEIILLKDLESYIVE